MLKLNWSSKFKSDIRRCAKRGCDMTLLENIIDTLRIPEALPQKNYDHTLSGEYTACRECHIQPDWLLIYKIYPDELYLIRTGTHSDLF